MFGLLLQPLPSPSCQQVISLSSCVSPVELTDGRVGKGVVEELNHTTRREPVHPWIIQYSLPFPHLSLDCNLFCFFEQVKAFTKTLMVFNLYRQSFWFRQGALISSPQQWIFVFTWWVYSMRYQKFSKTYSPLNIFLFLCCFLPKSG